MRIAARQDETFEAEVADGFRITIKALSASVYAECERLMMEATDQSYSPARKHRAAQAYKRKCLEHGLVDWDGLVDQNDEQVPMPVHGKNESPNVAEIESLIPAVTLTGVVDRILSLSGLGPESLGN